MGTYKKVTAKENKDILSFTITTSTMTRNMWRDFYWDNKPGEGWKLTDEVMLLGMSAWHDKRGKYGNDRSCSDHRGKNKATRKDESGDKGSCYC